MEIMVGPGFQRSSCITGLSIPEMESIKQWRMKHICLYGYTLTVRFGPCVIIYLCAKTQLYTIYTIPNTSWASSQRAQLTGSCGVDLTGTGTMCDSVLLANGHGVDLTRQQKYGDNV